MPIYSSQDVVNITDVQKIYLDALKQFPVMHLSPFEKIIDDDKGYVMSRQMNGNLSLKPNITKQGLLFRGDSCSQNQNKADRSYRAAINSMQFKKLIESFPLYEMLKNGVQLPNGETLCLENPFGLAYSYDLDTSFVGFTSELEVAMFYAVTRYDSISGQFEIVKNGTGVLYAYELRQPLRLTRSLTPLGLQVFPRTFFEKTFLLQIPNKADIDRHHAVIGFRFDHQEEIAQEIFEKYRGGELLAPTDDVLWKKLKSIKEGDTETALFQKNDLEELYIKIDEYWDKFISLIHFDNNEEDIKLFLQKLPQNNNYARYFDLTQYYNER